MPHCVNCGNELMENSSFCTHCGKTVTVTPIVFDAGSRRTSGPLPIGSYIKMGWELFKQNAWGFIAYTFVFFAISIALSLIPFVGGLVQFIVSAPLYMGIFIVSAKLLQGHTSQFGDFFLGFRFFVPLLLVNLVFLLIILIVACAAGLLTALIIGLLGRLAALPVLLLLIIPVTIYIGIGFMFAFPLALDRRPGAWASLKLSRNTMNPMFFRMLGFILLLTLINLAGALCLGLGLLVTIPLTWCTVTAAYADIFGLQSDYSESFPDNLSSEASTLGG